MPLPSLDQAAETVLGQYDDLRFPNRPLHFLGNAGGFSGARLWRVEGADASYCLRAWPVSFFPERLSSIHRLMIAARSSGLEFVPAVCLTQSLATWVKQTGRLWDVTSWQPGRADFRERPSQNRLEGACTALGRLHLAWAENPPAHGPCPAIQRRLSLLRAWLALVESGWRPAFLGAGSERLGFWAERAWRSLPRHVRGLPEQLSVWSDRGVALQPCLCDLWHDHVLFEGDIVTGIVDYGSTKQDHVAVDLARLLGSLVGDGVRQRALGLEEYGRQRSLTEDEIKLVAVLDKSGTVLAAANWLKWLFADGKKFEDPEAVANRLEEIVRRIENWEQH